MNTAKLKAAAEKARWGDWSAYKPHSGARGYEVRVGSEAVAQHCLKDDAAFIAEASPKAVLCLIAAMEAKDAQIAELLEKQRLIDICQGQGLEHRIAAERRAEAAEKRAAELEESELQLMEERDNAEEALADMYQAATGERPEWSNWFGYADAVGAVTERVAELDAGINLETGGE
ncbi:ead/Ea22-like family protein [Cronobacter sakazakii]|nr:ead/Ea22-like family protein [Cronobacter sakazakii]EJT6941310.1 ead/Ea22-like family protein [Cronobacter sakazakii]EJT8242525.1 ead/Ea22-like family protein [Cronobacter sakazakii]EJV9464874.1 ead/Ea22-like family protein [Cronobacter sakazakii]EJV9506069.1 ead/Ea22-like family protein [Cronobacter sakazakii]EMC4267950.1 ead/Ea22-like family protein [Cronobacter sakazakii]